MGRARNLDCQKERFDSRGHDGCCSLALTPLGISNVVVPNNKEAVENFHRKQPTVFACLISCGNHAHKEGGKGASDGEGAKEEARRRGEWREGGEKLCVCVCQEPSPSPFLCT